MEGKINYVELIKAVRGDTEDICSVEFCKGTMILTCQIGNRNGALIKMSFNNSKRIHNITFQYGGYSEPYTLKGVFDKLFDIIAKA